ncbi:hypothetical protein [Laspinema palackyanum]
MSPLQNHSLKYRNGTQGYDFGFVVLGVFNDRLSSAEGRGEKTRFPTR